MALATTAETVRFLKFSIWISELVVTPVLTVTLHCMPLLKEDI